MCKTPTIAVNTLIISKMKQHNKAAVVHPKTIILNLSKKSIVFFIHIHLWLNNIKYVYYIQLAMCTKLNIYFLTK